MNGDTFSIKAPKECSKKFAATFQEKFLTRGNVLIMFFLFLEDVGLPLLKRRRLSSYSEIRIAHHIFICLFVLRRCWGASLEKASPLKLL